MNIEDQKLREIVEDLFEKNMSRYRSSGAESDDIEEQLDRLYKEVDKLKTYQGDTDTADLIRCHIISIKNRINYIFKK